jgi:hypothetical protein
LVLRIGVKGIAGIAFNFDIGGFGAGCMSGLKPPTYRMR